MMCRSWGTSLNTTLKSTTYLLETLCWLSTKVWTPTPLGQHKFLTPPYPSFAPWVPSSSTTQSSTSSEPWSLYSGCSTCLYSSLQPGKILSILQGHFRILPSRINLFHVPSAIQSILIFVIEYILVDLDQHFSKCGPQTSSSNKTWGLVRNANSRGAPQTY